MPSGQVRKGTDVYADDVRPVRKASDEGGAYGDHDGLIIPPGHATFGNLMVRRKPVPVALRTCPPYPTASSCIKARRTYGVGERSPSPSLTVGREASVVVAVYFSSCEPKARNGRHEADAATGPYGINSINAIHGPAVATAVTDFAINRVAHGDVP